MFPSADPKNPSAVAAWVRQKFLKLYPSSPTTLLEPLFVGVAELFDGRHPAYGAIDLRYHDLEHTLEATVCLTELLDGFQRSAPGDALTARQFELALAAVLLHDAGYLKLRPDSQGTGAKYTFCHVLRSCAFAASYLPSLGVSEAEIGTVLSAINCTGPTKEISRLAFASPNERFIGNAVATADYLGQMAAADYPSELRVLFAEFEESDDYVQRPLNQRLFASAEDLIESTPAFWRSVVHPKLDREFQGAYRYLAKPFPDGSNPYLDAVARNIDVIERGLATLKGPVR